MVYGGGGIIPDVFVPIGSNEEEAIESMDSLGFIARFIFQHLEEDRTRYQDLTQEEYLMNFRVDDILFEQFVEYCLTNTIKLSFYDHEEQIKQYLKASLAEQLYSPHLHAKIKAGSDTMLQKVLELDQPTISQDQSVNTETKN